MAFNAAVVGYGIRTTKRNSAKNSTIWKIEYIPARIIVPKNPINVY